MKTQVELIISEDQIELLEGIIKSLKDDFLNCTFSKRSYLRLDVSFDDKDDFNNQITIGLNHHGNLDGEELRFILGNHESKILANSLNTMYELADKK